MYVIVGLGNPGKKYENTRHNMGFIAVDLIADKYGIKVNKIKHKALTGEGNIAGQKVLLVKPQTYMNLSGESVRDVANFYKIEMENLIVIYDDIDIPLGTIRLRKFGSAGTHNGMRSVVYQLQSDQFPRIRVGVGHPEHGDLVNFVTGGFAKKDVPVIEEALRGAAEAAVSIIEDGIDRAMNKYNTKKKASEDDVEEGDN